MVLIEKGEVFDTNLDKFSGFFNNYCGRFKVSDLKLGLIEKCTTIFQNNLGM